MKKVSFYLILVFCLSNGVFAQSISLSSDSLMSPFFDEWIEHKNSIYVDINSVPNQQVVRYFVTLTYSSQKVFETDTAIFDTLFYEQGDTLNQNFIDTFSLILKNYSDTLTAGNNRIYAEEFMRYSSLNFPDSLGSIIYDNRKLPSGSYTLNVQVYNSTYTSMLYNVSTSLNVGAYQSPGLIGPYDNAYVYAARTEEIQFEWYPLTPNPGNSILYQLIVYPYTDSTKSYYETITDTAEALIDLSFIDSTNCILPQAAALLLQSGQDYVWTIRSFDLNSGLPIGSNYGYAVPYIFRITSNSGDTFPKIFQKRSAGCIFDGFESARLDVDGWRYFNGKHSLYPYTGPNVRPDGISITEGRKDIEIMSTGNDGHFPAHIPLVPLGGGNHSIKLGGAIFDAGNDVDLMQKVFTVTPENAQFKIHYAYVGEDGKHSFMDQPGFRIILRRKNLGLSPKRNIIQHKEVFADANNPNSIVVELIEPTVGKQWKCYQVDLSNFIGQTVILEMYNLDCSAKWHDGYSYVDLCVEDLVAPTLNGPSTFCYADETYQLDGSASVAEQDHYIDIVELDNSQQEIEDTRERYMYFNKPAALFDIKALYEGDGRKFACNKYYKVTLAVKDNCTEWRTTTKTVFISCPAEGKAGQDLCCTSNPCTLYLGDNPSLGKTYLWSPSTCLSSANVANPTFNSGNCTPQWVNGVLKYVLRVDDEFNCSSYDTVRIFNGPPSNISIIEELVNCGVRLTATSTALGDVYWTNDKNSEILYGKTVFAKINGGDTVRFVANVSNPCGQDTLGKVVISSTLNWGPIDTLSWYDVVGREGLYISSVEDLQWEYNSYNLTQYKLYFNAEYGEWVKVKEGNIFDGFHPSGFYNGEIHWNLVYGGRRLMPDDYNFFLDLKNCSPGYENTFINRRYRKWACKDYHRTWFDIAFGLPGRCLNPKWETKSDTYKLYGGRLYLFIIVD